MRTEIRNLAAHGDHPAMQAVTDLARADELDDRDVADLARALARSGARLDTRSRSADLASTGGPSSLSTLICPLHLRARGLTVPKLGVRGRPAGGVDVLETIPGFRSTLDPNAAEAALERSGYIHLVADERWAPLDAGLFAYRQREGVPILPALVIASILAKKLAAGVTGAGLEIRIGPHGNFAAEFDNARSGARRYISVASRLGLRPVCALTDATRPYQPYIGRGEALLALAEVLSRGQCDWLAEHHSLCLRMSDAVASALGSETSHPVELSTMRQAHEEMLHAQGAELSAFWHRAEAVRNAPRRMILADRTGWIEYDLGSLRALLVEQQRSDGHPSHGSPSDSAGVILSARPGSHVEVGEPVMAVRASEQEERLAMQAQACVRIDSTEARPATRRAIEIIRGPAQERHART